MHHFRIDIQYSASWLSTFLLDVRLMVRKPKQRKHKSKRAKLRSKGVRVGVAWYASKDEWEKVRAFATDPDRLEETYPEWLAVAEKALKDIASAGVLPQKVALDADTLEQWCRNNERPNDASARAEFASRLLKEWYERKVEGV